VGYDPLLSIFSQMRVNGSTHKRASGSMPFVGLLSFSNIPYSYRFLSSIISRLISTIFHFSRKRDISSTGKGAIGSVPLGGTFSLF